MENKRVSDSESTDIILNAIDRLDTQKVDSLKKMLQFQLIKQAELEAELNRFLEKKGPNNSRVQKIQSRMVYNKGLFEALDLQIKLASSKTENLNPDAWRIQGIVFDTNKTLLPDLKVFIAIEKGKSYKDQLFSVTNNQGFYSITVEGEMVEKLRQTKIFLQVSDKKKNVIHTENKPLMPTRGIIDFEDILIPKYGG